MTIDEAINILKSDNDYNKSIGCDTLYEEQLAEWLEELKELKKSAPNRMLYMMGFKAGYNKAIDDFVKSIRDIVFDYYTNGAYINYDDLLMKAEQLKEGAGNGIDNK